MKPTLTLSTGFTTFFTSVNRYCCTCLGTFGVAMAVFCGCATTSEPRLAEEGNPTTPLTEAPTTDDTRSSSGASESTIAAKQSQYPHIEANLEHSGSKRVRITFPFENETIRFEMKVDKAVLWGAVHAPKYAVAQSGNEDRDWRERYNLAFIEDPVQAPFLDDLHQLLTDIASKKKLDGDRTVELMTSFVQHIEYDETSNAEARFPIETFAGQKGDCDDKSRLLVALLQRSGYQVATLHFRDENHMAVGIRSNAMEYRGTGYTYIESTSPSLVGFPFAETANIQLKTTPVAQRIGTGTQSYKAAKQIEWLVKTKETLESDIARQQEKLQAMDQKCTEASEKVETLQRKLNAAREASEHNRLVDQYNSSVQAYNSLVQKQQKMARSVNQKIEIRNYITKHAVARHPTCLWVKQQLEK